MTILLDENVKPVFGRHEKFPFRHGWLKKGVDAVRKDPLIFTSDEAVVELGVGKNMVRSIRHWGQAVDLLELVESPGRAKAFGPSLLANRLLAPGGWDPFLESIASMWLLHWHLVSNKERALVWHLVFSSYLEAEFSKNQLTAHLIRLFERLNVRTTEGVIKREIDCFLNTYVTGWSKKQRILEDSLDCPLTELNLIRFAPDDGMYRFNVGPKPSLPVEVFAYGLFHFLAEITQTRQTVAVEECLYQPGSPGQVFKLDENTVSEYLERVEQITGGAIRLQETAGLRQIFIASNEKSMLLTKAIVLLDGFYD